jgi:hypothetical protein
MAPRTWAEMRESIAARLERQTGHDMFLLATADELLDAQYADRPALGPILDTVVASASTFGAVEVQARKTHTCLITPRRAYDASL